MVAYGSSDVHLGNRKTSRLAGRFASVREVTSLRDVLSLTGQLWNFTSGSRAGKYSMGRWAALEMGWLVRTRTGTGPPLCDEEDGLTSDSTGERSVSGECVEAREPMRWRRKSRGRPLSWSPR